MRARVERGRIVVVMEQHEAEDVRLIANMTAAIGSFNPKDHGERVVSCALSITNFKKLKRFGCKLDQDAHTLDVVNKLRGELALYERESLQGNEAKAGHGFGPIYNFKVPPFEHQHTGYHFLHSMQTPALFGDCGVGKTFQVATFADSLICTGTKIVFLVVCPVNLIQHVWLDDIEKFTRLSAVGLREPTVPRILAQDWDKGADRTDSAARKKALGRARRRHKKLVDERFDQDVDMYIVNLEQLRTDAKEKKVRDLLKRKRKDGFEVGLIIDESSRIKTRTSRAYKTLKRLRGLCSRCIIMTGTPSPNGILDLWAQFSILDDGLTLQPSFIDYRQDTCYEKPIYGAKYVDKSGTTRIPVKWEPTPEKAKDVYEWIRPRTVRFKLEDCIDLPPHQFIRRDVELNKEQTTAYSDMETMLFTELENEPVTATVAASKLMKLREITGGFLITDKRKEVPLGKSSPKMLELDQLLEQSVALQLGDDGPPNKALIWANYQWECKTLVQRYKKYGARGLFGGISSSAKDRAIREFKDNPRCQILICHPASAGHGLTLTEANYAFYYSLSYNFEEFYQSFRRMTRPGQKRRMTYYFLVVPDSIDEDLIEAIQNKKNLSDLITDGHFSRERFLDRRVKANNQFEISWEVPHENSPKGGG